jgi:cytochrome c oxidase assembly factor CtaG
VTTQHLTTAALARPSVLGLADAWTVQPVALVAAVLALAWYLRGVRRVGGWPAGRTAGFVVGVAVFVWSTSGFAQVYAPALFWVFTSQMLILLLVVPVALMAGQPVTLARSVHGPDATLVRITRSGVGRLFANPLVGPALIPVLSGGLFFGPLPRWALDSTALGWTLPLLVVAAGALIVLPLVGTDDQSSSLAVGLSLAIGCFELVLDAVPGIVLRLNTHVSTSYFDARSVNSWAPDALHDQQIAGAILWSVAELIDLPFLILVYRRWLRADERDAAAIDTVLDAERIARGGEDAAPTDEPWWLNDPAMRDRLRRK